MDDGAALARLAGLEDRFAIADLMERYCDCLDARDWTMFRELFSEDVRVSNAAMYGESRGRDAHVATVADIAERYFTAYQHHVTNLAVTVDGDAAVGRAFLLFVVVLAGGPAEPLVSGSRYRIGFRRTPTGWRIAELVISSQLADPRYAAMKASVPVFHPTDRMEPHAGPTG